jgi:hypothetical protein
MELINSAAFKNQRLIKLVKEVVAEYYGRDESDYYAKSSKNPEKMSREEEHIKLRRTAIYVLKVIAPKIPLGLIGTSFGGFNHATVLHHQRTMANLVETEKNLKECVNQIVGIIASKEKEKISLGKDFYYVDLNNVSVLKLSDEQSILFTGVSDATINAIKEQFFKENNSKIKHFKDTSLYILDKQTQNKNEKNSHTSSRV